MSAKTARKTARPALDPAFEGTLWKRVGEEVWHAFLLTVDYGYADPDPWDLRPLCYYGVNAEHAEARCYDALSCEGEERARVTHIRRRTSRDVPARR